VLRGRLAPEARKANLALDTAEPGISIPDRPGESRAWAAGMVWSEDGRRGINPPKSPSPLTPQPAHLTPTWPGGIEFPISEPA
jgi:hypothetical protein